MMWAGADVAPSRQMGGEIGKARRGELREQENTETGVVGKGDYEGCSKHVRKRVRWISHGQRGTGR